MPIHLLDVNVLIALCWSHHQHHQAANAWFAEGTLGGSGGGWATCPITEMSFIRLSMNPVSMRSTISTTEAANGLRNLISHPNHYFWTDELSLLNPLVLTKQVRGHRQVTDAYLFALCMHHKGVLATFDRGTLSLAATPEQRKSIFLIPT